MATIADARGTGIHERLMLNSVTLRIDHRRV